MNFSSYRAPSHEALVARHIAQQGHEVTFVVNQPPPWDGPLPKTFRQVVLPIDEALAKQQWDLVAKELLPEENDVDVAFTASASGAPFLTEWRKKAKRPCVAQVLDVPMWRLRAGPKYPWHAQWRPWYDNLCRMDALVANTEQTRRDLMELPSIYGESGRNLPPISVVYYGIDTSMADKSERAIIPRNEIGDKPIACVANRLVAYKGLELAIPALSLVPESSRPVYLIIGDGEDGLRLHQLAMLCGVDAKFVGGVDDATKWALIKASDYGLAPAYNPNIPFQYPMESVYVGKPCLVADTPINRERFCDETGQPRGVVFVNPFDTRAVADAVNHFGQLHREGMKPLRVAEDQEWIRENRSYASHAHGVLEALRQVIAGP